MDDLALSTAMAVLIAWSSDVIEELRPQLLCQAQRFNEELHGQAQRFNEQLEQ